MLVKARCSICFRQVSLQNTERESFKINKGNPTIRKLTEHHLLTVPAVAPVFLEVSGTLGIASRFLPCKCAAVTGAEKRSLKAARGLPQNDPFSPKQVCPAAQGRMAPLSLCMHLKPFLSGRHLEAVRAFLILKRQCNMETIEHSPLFFLL